MVGARRSRNSPARIRRLGSAHRSVSCSNVQTTFRWALYDREPLPVWTRDRLSLLGDAAHPMLPHLGQGANQSIEDGMALATILGARGPAPALPAPCSPTSNCAASAWRRSSAARAKAGCVTIQPIPIWVSGMPRSQPTPTFRKRLYDYDVVPEATGCGGSAGVTLTRRHPAGSPPRWRRSGRTASDPGRCRAQQ